MLSIENPPPDPSSCPCEISQLNSCSDDQQPSGVLHSDLLISCPKFTIRDYAFSNRSKDIKTNWPFSEKSLQLCLNHGVKDLLPPIQSLDVVKNPAAQGCSVATSVVSKETKCHLINQASRPANHLLSFTSDDIRPDLTSVSTSLGKSEGVRIFSSMLEEAEASLNHPATKPVKKSSLVVKVENIMKPLSKKCREIVKLCNTAADQNKLENNTSNNFFMLETMASKVCPVCKTFTSSSNTTLNAHIDQCLSGESISQWTSDPKVTKSRIKPKRMRSMVDIYETAQHCTVEELERRNGINLTSCLSLSAQDFEVGSVERKRKSPVDFEEIENEAAVYVDKNGTKLRILSKFDDLSSPVVPQDDTGSRRHADGNKSSKLTLAKKKKKKLEEKHHKLQIHVPDGKKLCSPRQSEEFQINAIQEDPTGIEEHLEVEEAFAKPQRAHGSLKYIEPESVGRRACSKPSVLTKMNDKGGHLHSTWPREKKLAGVNNVESPCYSRVNGSCGSKSNMSSGTPPASPRSSEPHDDYGRVLLLRRSVRVPLGSELCYDRNNPLDEGNRKELRESDSSVKCKSKDKLKVPSGSELCYDRNNPLEGGNRKELRESDSSVKCKSKDKLRNKLNPNASLSIRKVKIKRALATNSSSVGDNSKHISDGHDLSSKSRGFSSVMQKQASRLSNLQASAPKSTFGPKNKVVDLKRPHAYGESESDGAEIVRQTVSKIADNAIRDRRVLKVRIDREKVRVSGKGETLVFKDRKSTRKHQEPQNDGINDSYSDNVTTGLDDKKESTQNNVQPCEKDALDEATCNNSFFLASRGLSNSSGVQCYEVAGHFDVQSDSRGYMKLSDEPSLGTEGARYPVESILNGGEKMFSIGEDGNGIFGQNVHGTTELHSNDGSGSYYAEVDLIPIPGPPGSFLPSPSSDEFHGNSTPTSSQDQSSENHHEFVHRDSSDSPTSTISNSDIAKFDSSLIERFPFRHSNPYVIRAGVSDATGGTMVDKVSLDPSAAFAGCPVEPKGHLLYTDMAAQLRLKNDQPCRCSRRDGALLSSSVLNYQDTSLLSCPPMPLVPESPYNKQVDSDVAKNHNLMLNVPSSGQLAGERITGDLLGLIPNKACTNSGVKFFFNTDGESASPSTCNPILRLMGKDLMVVNKDETSYSHQTGKEIIVLDEACESSADLVTLGMGLMNYRGPSINPALMATGVTPRNFNSMYSYLPRTSCSESLPLAQTTSFQVEPMMGVNSSFPIKWNCVAQGSNTVPRGSFPSSTSAAKDMRSTTYQSGGYL